MRLIAITPGDGCDLATRIHAARAGGADHVLLREPMLHLDLLGPGVLLHGRTPGALAAAAHTGCGLHLPASMDAAAARGVISGTLSQSCHDAAALARAAAAGCDFAFLSPVFSPHSKPDDTRVPLGLDGLALLCASAALPVVALGGVSPDRVAGCQGAGAVGVACIGAIFGAADVAAAAAEMRRACGLSAVLR
ncbi:MAG: thiamine phosphate synthase [Myxococcota bacterium]|nr:thiamine phosphate synthase [Myxococcota bacterium]